MAGILDNLREAQRLYRSAEEIVAGTIAQLGGGETRRAASVARTEGGMSGASGAVATRSRRGRPAKDAGAGNAAGTGKLNAAELVAKIAASKRGMTREEILKATGWAPSAANLQLDRLVKKEGKLAFVGNRYTAPPPAAEQTATTAAAA